MADIVLTAAVRSNLLALQNTAKLLGKTQERLATGLKVNSALDDPNAFFTAASLNARSSDLNRLLDSVDLAVQTIKAADQGISAITKLVESAQALARQALLSPPTTATTTGSGVTLTNATTLDTDLGFAVGETITVTTTSGTTTHTVAAADTVADLIATLDANADVNVSLTASGALRIDAVDSTGFTIGGTGDVTRLGLTAGAVAGTTNTTRQSLSVQYDEILNQITQLAQDAQFNGVNLLNSDNLTVIFNEDGSSQLVINGVDFTAPGLGLSPVTDALQGNAETNGKLAQLDAALKTLRAQASAFGANLSVVEVRKDFTKNLINTLETGAANLTLADSNEEGANLLALQTRQQLSSTALSLAAQADQNVLRLFN